jgi:hypothetical protein
MARMDCAEFHGGLNDPSSKAIASLSRELIDFENLTPPDIETGQIFCLAPLLEETILL